MGALPAAVLLLLCIGTLAEEMIQNTETRSVSAGMMDMFFFEGPDWQQNLSAPIAITSFTARVYDIEGNLLGQDEAYFHHLLISAANIQSTACPENGYNLMFGSGAELSDINLPYPYALRTNPGDEWFATVHVVNPSDHEVEYFIQWIINVEDWSDEYTEVKGYLDSVVGCQEDLDFDIPETDAPVSIIHAEFPAAVTGNFVWATGHLHRGGRNMYITKTDTAETIGSYNVHYDDPENEEFITSIDHGPASFRMEIGTPFRITAIYEPFEQIEQMGIFFGYLVVEEIFEGSRYRIFGTDNPFAPTEEPIEDDRDLTISTLTTISSVEESSEERASSEGKNSTEKKNEAFFGFLATGGFFILFWAIVSLIIASVVLIRLRAKRRVELLDE